jgi:hypothetical protein
MGVDAKVVQELLRHASLPSGRFATLCFLQTISEQAEERNILYGALLRTRWKCVPAWVSDGQNRAFVQMHHPLLLVLLGLISKVVECQDEIALGKHCSHQVGSI